jgi:hypothetical protein
VVGSDNSPSAVASTFATFCRQHPTLFSLRPIGCMLPFKPP